MPRRQGNVTQLNRERWVVSYADFITLLFAFFVVMYSMSQVNEKKYRVLSNTLSKAFSTPSLTLQPVQIGEPSKDHSVDAIKLADNARLYDSSDKENCKLQDCEDFTDRQQNDALEEIGDAVKEKFQGLIDDKLLSIRSNKLWVEIELKSKLLFASGDAMPSAAAEMMVKEVAAILVKYQNPIHVEGYTDNVPISNDLFPSNWELSSARAAAVVQLLVAGGVVPQRLAAVGYGEFQPIADNTTVQGRSDNRRVVLVVSKDLNVRRSISNMGANRASTDEELLLHLQTTEKNKQPLLNIENEAAGETPAENNEVEGMDIIQLNSGGLLFTQQGDERAKSIKGKKDEKK